MLEAASLDHLAKELRPLLVPGASRPFHARRLITDPVSNATAMLVYFPSGWTRMAGSYSCVEHAVLLDGILEIDGFECRPGAGFLIPAGAIRWSAQSSGALALAWFSSSPVWRAAPKQTQTETSKVSSVLAWPGDRPSGVFDLVDLQLRTWLHVNSEETSQVDLESYALGDGALAFQWKAEAVAAAT